MQDESAFATIYDLNDVSRGSGTFYNLAKEIESQVIRFRALVHVFRCPVYGPVDQQCASPTGKTASNLSRSFCGQTDGTPGGPATDKRGLRHLADQRHGHWSVHSTSKPVVIYTDVMIKPDYSEKDLPVAAW